MKHDRNKMRKSLGNTYNVIADARNNDCLELTRRLYKGVTEVAKKLDEQKDQALTVSDLFTPSGEVLRTKLRDYCERLIFKDPVGHARKTEELLWRRGFYDVVSAAKKLRKGNTWKDTEKALLSAHLSVGVGFYHHLILRLQYECNLCLVGVIDFAYTHNKNEPSNSSKGGKVVQFTLHTQEIKQCAVRLIHRSLVCLGDLARYRLDLDPNWDPLIAKRYYKMAIAIDPGIGMPHNQLGTVAGNKNYGLDAVYHYLRCMLCSEPFEGAEGNLKRAISTHSFSGKESNPPQKCVARLLSLLQLWDSESPNLDRVNHDSQELLNDIESCLSVLEPTESGSKPLEEEDNIETYLQNCKNETTGHLTSDMLFKIVSICLMSISKLRSKDSSEVSGVIAFTLAVLSQLLQSTIAKLSEKIHEVSRTSRGGNPSKETNGTSVTNGVKPSARDKKSLLTKLRRPRNKKQSSSDSDGSDLEVVSSNSEISENDEDVLSEENGVSEDEDEDDEDEEELLSEDASDTEEMSKKRRNGLEKKRKPQQEPEAPEKSENSKETPEIADESLQEREVLREKGEIEVEELLRIFADCDALATLKICFDWLQSNPEIVRTCTKSSRILINRIVSFLNLVKIEEGDLVPRNFGADEETQSWFLSNEDRLRSCASSVPLPEDVDLRGLNVLELSQKSLDWEILHKRGMRGVEETAIRLLKFGKFGGFLCSMQQSLVQLDRERKFLLVLEDKRTPEKSHEVVVPNENEHPRGKLMRHMGRLWLKAEVRALENRLHSKLMSPYLVPDHEALAKHTPALKRLVYAKKFIVVIPSVVVSALDEVKRTSGRAREATRWLEAQLRRGSRFLRAQRPHERLALPFIKGPRPKDKEAFLFFQIIECCHYLTQQTKTSLSSDAEPPVVTLLTGCGLDDRKALTFSPDGLAKSAGVNLEHIESFHTKWKSSSKSHG